MSENEGKYNVRVFLSSGRFVTMTNTTKHKADSIADNLIGKCYPVSFIDVNGTSCHINPHHVSSVEISRFNGGK